MFERRSRACRVSIRRAPGAIGPNHLTTNGTTDPWGNDRVAYSATTRIVRSDFGVTFNAALETGGVMVSDEVDITLDIEAIAAA